MPAVRRTYPGLLDVAPKATEFIALFTIVCASVTDVASMNIVFGSVAKNSRKYVNL